MSVPPVGEGVGVAVTVVVVAMVGVRSRRRTARRRCHRRRTWRAAYWSAPRLQSALTLIALRRWARWRRCQRWALSLSAVDVRQRRRSWGCRRGSRRHLPHRQEGERVRVARNGERRVVQDGGSHHGAGLGERQDRRHNDDRSTRRGLLRRATRARAIGQRGHVSDRRARRPDARHGAIALGSDKHGVDARRAGRVAQGAQAQRAVMPPSLGVAGPQPAPGLPL